MGGSLQRSDADEGMLGDLDKPFFLYVVICTQILTFSRVTNHIVRRQHFVELIHLFIELSKFSFDNNLPGQTLRLFSSNSFHWNFRLRLRSRTSSTFCFEIRFHRLTFFELWLGFFLGNRKKKLCSDSQRVSRLPWSLIILLFLLWNNAPVFLAFMK